MTDAPFLLFCCCKYANIVPDNTKHEILRFFTRTGTPFHAVPDLCEMASRGDPAMKSMVEQEKLTIVACYPRAVKSLFQAAETPFKQEKTTVLNMRTESAETIIDALSKKEST
ncbi:MAG: hypothetical protein C4527_01945 [Candidatus Omnitrophota bacterium]|jgi:hypothetical protein|nr:MAG: hypothetical protein C4527_01945 [Candidatus Omnitrophota bacterium]